jgi:hypothetical protein
MNRTISSIRSVIGWPRTAILALATAGLVVAGLSASVVPASASPAAPRSGINEFVFMASGGHVTGGGHTWNLNVDLESFGTAVTSAAFEISTPHLGGTESYTWGGILGNGDWSVSPSAALTINTHSSLSPVTLNLSFNPTSHKTEKADCSTGSDLVYTGTLSGSVEVTTGLKGLKLSGAHVSFGDKNTLSVISHCVQDPCNIEGWDSSTNSPANSATATGIVAQIPGRVVSSVVVDTSVTLKNNVFRLSSWQVETKAPVFNKSSKSLSVISTSSGLVTGAATLAHGKQTGTTETGTCYINGKKYSQSAADYERATYEPSRQFEAHTILSGTVKVNPHGVADFDIVTIKNA